MWVFYLVIMVIFEALADILVKEWTIRSFWPWAIAALATYLFANVFWLFSMKNGAGLGRGAVLFSILSGVLGIFIGIALYKEPASRNQIFALFFGLISIFFFALNE